MSTTPTKTAQPKVSTTTNSSSQQIDLSNQKNSDPANLAKRPIPTNSSSRLPKILIGSIVVLGVLASAAWGLRSFLAEDPTDETLTHPVEKTNLRITVTERGTLESQKTVDGVCELRGYQNKIIFIVDEGETVKKGDVVVRFDNAEIEKEYAQAEIQVNTAKSKVASTLQEVEVKENEGDSLIAAAKLELTLADLDLKKYRDGDYIVELNKLKGLIALAEVELEKANDQLENTKMLVKKGFREPEQLRGAEQQVESAKYSLTRDKETLKVLQDFGKERQMVELKAKFEEAGRKLIRAKKTKEATVAKATSEHEAAKAELAIVERELSEWQRQREKCEITAKQSGVLAYANEDWYGDDRRIREGAVVHRRQKIFSLPNLKLMQVKVNVHESVVKKVKEKQKAIVRVSAFQNQPLDGVVKSVSQLADSSHGWGRGGVKEYSTIVTLPENPPIPIKPGMSAEVEIRVDHLSDVIAVPVQAVTEHKHQHFVYIKQGNAFERRDVEIGQSNNRMVEITSGLDVGEEVALDARARGIVDFEDAEDLESEFDDDDESDEAGSGTDDGAKAESSSAPSTASSVLSAPVNSETNTATNAKPAASSESAPSNGTPSESVSKQNESAKDGNTAEQVNEDKTNQDAGNADDAEQENTVTESFQADFDVAK